MGERVSKLVEVLGWCALLAPTLNVSWQLWHLRGGREGDHDNLDKVLLFEACVQFCVLLSWDKLVQLSNTVPSILGIWEATDGVPVRQAAGPLLWGTW